MPVSRILYRTHARGDDHLSGARIATHLGATWLDRTGRPSLTGWFERSCFRWGLPERASPRHSVSSYLTISPLPATSAGGMFLWHFPSSRPDRTLSCTLPSEARTFLTTHCMARSSSVLRRASIPQVRRACGHVRNPARPIPARPIRPFDTGVVQEVALSRHAPEVRRDSFISSRTEAGSRSWTVAS